MTYRRGQPIRRNMRRRGLQRTINSNVNVRFTGAPRRITNDPPMFVSIPWNSLMLDTTIQFSASQNSKEIKAGTLWDIFKTQFGIGVNLSGQIEFRVFQIAAWETKGNPLVMNIYDFPLPRLLYHLEDDPGRNHWAAVAYRYPQTQSNVCLLGNDTTTTVASVTSAESGEIKVRIRVLWKFSYSNVPTRILSADIASDFACLDLDSSLVD